MHFWIDKRSQSCGFGRTRAGFAASGNGYDFYHPPRRIGGKSMVTPIHRFQSVDCRPHIHRQSNHQEQQHHHQQHHHQQAQSLNARVQSQYRAHANVHMPSAVIQQYQSHALEMEQRSLGLNSIQQAHDVLSDESNALPIAVNDAVNTADTQILPSHLKCGMWCSLALATVFLAAFQGSGLEILIFCAFSATFFVAACTVSLCRRPRHHNLDISTTQLNTVATNFNEIEAIPIDQHESHVSHVVGTMSAPPPPYHIAILTADTPKTIDDSPPPSYDKLTYNNTQRKAT